ncbi:hypothetical protein VKT23_002480 [Stygiomarasmius scandens]|uniref:Uncharacterized protein n=1 Tax=Marasmiellus scandens TaxID=2682957 RepID=A0ABR1K4V8_9AGAR
MVPPPSALEIAKKQLGYDSIASNSVVPKNYLEELKHHLSLNPDDYNFRIAPTPGTGFGSAKCLETGCKKTTIQLPRNGKLEDGGKAEGIGSLRAYREHIALHHKNKAQKLADNEPVQDKKPSLKPTAAITSPPTSPLTGTIQRARAARPSTSNSRRTSTIKTKTEPADPILILSSPESSKPRELTPLERARQRTSLGRVKQRPTAGPSSSKAASSTVSSKAAMARALGPRVSLPSIETMPPPLKAPVLKSSPEASPVQSVPASSLPTPTTTSKTTTDERGSPRKRPLAEVLSKSSSQLEPTTPTKKVKKESTSTAPLSILTNTMDAGSSTALAYPSPVNLEDIRSQIDDLQMKISLEQRKLDTFLRKTNKTKGDYTRITNLTNEIDALKMQRDEYRNAIPAMSPIKRSPSKASLTPTATTTATALKQDENAHSGNFLGAVGRTSESLDVKRAPSAIAVAGPSVMKCTGDPVVNAASGSGVKKEQMDPFVLPPPPQPGAALPFVKNEPGLPQHQVIAGPSTKPMDVYGYQNSAFPMDIDDPFLDQTGAKGYDPIDNVLRNFEGVNAYAGPDHWDENGDFYGRGRDMFQGPVAKADDIEKFLVAAGNAELFDGSATVEQALQKLGLPNLYTPISGMEVALMPHQTIGVAWMLEKEKSDLKGGIMGDDMGLGKTVQMIAVMVKNRSQNPNRKTSLVLAPQALLDQWKMEIELKTNDGLKCLIYHGSSKPKQLAELSDYDVVLTTYHTMALEWPDYEAEMKKKVKKPKDGDDFIVDDEDTGKSKGKKKAQQLGLLFQAQWYRIICDEAQVIRNKRTRMSRAVTELQSIYRWCLTGTPIINTLNDTYSYLRFIQMRPWYDWSDFQSHIGKYEKKNPKLAIARLQKVLDTCLLRRKKDSMLDGKRLVELPSKEVVLQKLQFTEEEREIYQAVETQSQHKFNRYLRAGTVLKNYSHVLVLLLRLRQCCSHPALIQEDGGVAFLKPDEIDDDTRPGVGKELKKARDLVGDEFVDKMKEKLRLAALERMAENGNDNEASDEKSGDDECPICFDVFTDAVVTPCGHVFCRDCLLDVFNTPLAAGNDQLEADERPCPTCRSPVCQDLIFSRAAFEPTEEELHPKAHDSDVEMFDVEEALAPKKRGRGKGTAKSKRSRGDKVIDVDALDSEDDYEEEDDDDDNLSDFIVSDGADDDDEYVPRSRRKMKKPMVSKRKNVIVVDSDEEEEQSPEEKVLIFGRKRKSLSAKEIKMLPRFFPSTKMKFMMESIVKLAKERPDEKTMIVSQWTGCLGLVSDYLEENKIPHVKYQGDMNRHQRDAAVRIFMSKQNSKIMLMSLKCGGVGLNLTRANNVISLDLGWSQAIEDQAFDRVHRLGQVREVKVNRLVIENTVEDRILDMQRRKQDLADGSLGEGNGKKIGKLSVKELANLFGLNEHGGRL